MAAYQILIQWLKPKPKTPGAQAEHLATQYLMQQGLTRIATNFYCHGGEIDLIMLKKPRTLVFVEVKYRKKNDCGGTLAAIDGTKQKRIRHTAAVFMHQYKKWHSYQPRFDAILIEGTLIKQNIRWIQNAF